MNDLFTSPAMQVAVHLATMTEIIVERRHWCKGEIACDCLIPQKDEKGKWQLCHACYSESELTFDRSEAVGFKIELDFLKKVTK